MQRPSRFARSLRQCLDAWRQRLGRRRLASRRRFRPVLEALERIEAPNVLANPVANALGAALLGWPAADPGGETAFPTAFSRERDSARGGERTWLSAELSAPRLAYSLLAAPPAQAGDHVAAPVFAAPAASTTSSPVDDLFASGQSPWAVSWGFPELALAGGSPTAAARAGTRSSPAAGNPLAEGSGGPAGPLGPDPNASPILTHSATGLIPSGEDPFAWVRDLATTSPPTGPERGGTAAAPSRAATQVHHAAGAALGVPAVVPPKPPGQHIFPNHCDGGGGGCGGGGGGGSGINNLTVRNVNLHLTEGVAGSNVLVATFTDADGNTDPTKYTATVAWGDGTTTPNANLTISYVGATNSFQVAVPAGHAYAEEGSYSFTVSITDSDGDTAFPPGTVVVADAALTAGTPLSPSATQGVPFSGAVGTFTDADPNGVVGDYTALINWGDGSAPGLGTVTAGGGAFTVSGTHTYAAAGTYSVQTTAGDAGGSRTTLTATMTVAVPALAISPANPTFTEGNAGGSVVVATFTDIDNNTNPAPYTAQVNWGDGLAPTTATVSYVSGVGLQVTAPAGYAYPEEGIFTYTVTVTDNAHSPAVVVSATGTATVHDAALLPAGVPVNAVTGQLFSGTVGTFTDADPAGTTSDYGATISWGDGTATDMGTVGRPHTGGGFQVQGGHVYASAAGSPYTVTVTLTDGNPAQQGFQIQFTTTATVGPPVGVTADNLNPVEGQPFSGTVATYLPPAGGSGSYAAQIAWGDGAVTAGTLAPAGGGSYTVSGTHTYADETPSGQPDSLTVTVRDTGNSSTPTMSGSASVTVADAALTAGSVPALTGYATVPTGQILVGHFTDANPSAPAADFTASVSWGDSTAASAGTVVAHTGGGFDVYAAHTYASANTYTISTTVTDDGGQTVALSATITVGTAVPTSLTATEGIAYTGVVATFSSSSTPTGATIYWGDGSSSSGVVTSGSGTVTVTAPAGGHAYADEGTYPLAVTVTLSGSGPLAAAGPATVNDAALTAATNNLTFSGTVNAELPTAAPLLHFTDANPSASSADFSATMDWGDGEVDTIYPQANGGGFDVTGQHAYAEAGSYTTTLTVTDDGGQTLVVTGTATIALVEGETYSAEIAVSPIGSTAVTDYVAGIDWGDGSTSPAAVTPVYQTSGGYALQDLLVSADHVYQEEGSYTITATLEDPNSDTATGTASVTVTDAPLNPTGATISAVAGEATPTQTLGTFQDDNPYATAADFTASVGTVVAQGDGDFAVVGSVTYPSSGPLNITVTDDGGQSTVIDSTVSVEPPWTAFPGGGGGGFGDNGGTGSGAGTGDRTDDPSQSFMLPLGEATVDLNQGGLRLSQPLDFDLSPGTAVGGSPSLAYNSATVGVFPLIQLGLEGDPAGPHPTQVQVTLTFNGVAQSPVTFPIGGPPGPDGAYQFAVRSTSQVTSTGAYNWSATLVATMPDSSTHTANTSGTALVVARDASPYGAGWWISGLDQLVIGSAGVLWVTGSGDTRYFSGTGPGYTSPAEDFGTLVQNGDHTLTYTAKDQTRLNFDIFGRLTSVVDTHGLALVYHYDGSGRLAQVIAPDASVTTLAYNATTGLLSTITEPGVSRVVTTAMDASGNLHQITDAAGYVRTLGFDGSHHATSDQWDPLNATFSYDPASGLLTGVNRGLGTTYAIVSAAADDLGSAGTGPRWASVTDGLSHTTHYLLDGRGRLLEQVEADGVATTTYLRDGHGQVVEQIDPLGDPTDYTYDYAAGDGDLVQVAYADGSATSYQYDPTFHHVTLTTDNAGETTTDTYDPATGDLLTSTDALGNTTTYAWSAGLLQSVTDAYGRVTAEYVYDTSRRQIAAYDALGDETLTSYDANGNPSVTYDPTGVPTFTTYDADNRLWYTTDAYGAYTLQVHDAYGLVTGTRDARGNTATTAYDQRGWVSYTTDYLGVTTETDTYDAAGNLLNSTDADGNTTTYTYDADNRQTGVADAAGDPPTTTAYDLAGDVVSTTTALTRTTTYRYDRLNRRVGQTDPLGRITTSLFDLAGNAVLGADGLGLFTRTFFDKDGRAVQTRDPKGLSTYTLYDRVGNVSETIDALGRASWFFYDAANRPVGTKDPDGFTTATSYDRRGNVVRTVDERGKATTSAYDLLDRRVSTTDPDGRTTRQGYDPDGNVVTTTTGPRPTPTTPTTG